MLLAALWVRRLLHSLATKMNKTFPRSWCGSSLVRPRPHPSAGHLMVTEARKRSGYETNVHVEDLTIKTVATKAWRLKTKLEARSPTTKWLDGLACSWYGTKLWLLMGYLQHFLQTIPITIHMWSTYVATASHHTDICVYQACLSCYPTTDPPSISMRWGLFMWMLLSMFVTHYMSSLIWECCPSRSCTAYFTGVSFLLTIYPLVVQTCKHCSTSSLILYHGRTWGTPTIGIEIKCVFNTQLIHEASLALQDWEMLQDMLLIFWEQRCMCSSCI